MQSVDVIKYTDEEYEKYLTDPVCTQSLTFSNSLSFCHTYSTTGTRVFCRLYIDHLRF